jgi:uncharacterized membrane protein
MATVLLALSTAALFGFSDFLGGVASRRDSALAVTAQAHVIGVVLFAAALLVMPATAPRAADYAWGVAAGLAGGCGVVALYAALAAGRMSIVAPITAALSGSLPAAFDLVRGTAIRPVGLVGLGLAVVSIVIVSASAGSEEEHAIPRRAIVLSILAGLGFAGSLLAFSYTAPTSGIWPLLAARGTSALLFAAVALLVRGRLLLTRTALAPALAAGAFDAAANVTMLAAIRSGPLAVASVLGSLYPVVVILLARIVLKERLRGMQRVGVVMALIAVVLAATG